MSSNLVKCTICAKHITRGNISRHKSVTHGSSPCQRCVRKSVVKVSDLEKAQKAVAEELGIHYWFQSFQHRLLADMILDRIREMSGIHDHTETSDIGLKSWYHAAILDLEYFWLNQNYSLHNLIYCLLRESVNNGGRLV